LSAGLVPSRSGEALDEDANIIDLGHWAPPGGRNATKVDDIGLFGFGQRRPIRIRRPPRHGTATGRATSPRAGLADRAPPLAMGCVAGGDPDGRLLHEASAQFPSAALQELSLPARARPGRRARPRHLRSRHRFDQIIATERPARGCRAIRPHRSGPELAATKEPPPHAPRHPPVAGYFSLFSYPWHWSCNRRRLRGHSALTITAGSRIVAPAPSPRAHLSGKWASPRAEARPPHTTKHPKKGKVRRTLVEQTGPTTTRRASQE
jgi:hypothetical protein